MDCADCERRGINTVSSLDGDLASEAFRESVTGVARAAISFFSSSVAGTIIGSLQQGSALVTLQ